MAQNLFVSKLVSKTQLTQEIWEFKYFVPEDFTYTAGQFMNISVTPPFKRPYSIVETKNGTATFIINIGSPGKGSDFFNAAKLGDETTMSGPFGRFFYKETLQDKMFVANGCGVAPFIPMIKELVNPAEDAELKIYLALGIRYKSDRIIVEKYLGDLLNYDNSKFEFYDAVSRAGEDELTFFTGHVTDLLRDKIDVDFQKTEFYTCGSNDFVTEVKQILKEKNAQYVYVENYG